MEGNDKNDRDWLVLVVVIMPVFMMALCLLSVLP